MGLQLQPHRQPVLSGGFHDRLFDPLLLQPDSESLQLARQRDNYQNFLVYVNPRDLHRFLLAWKRQNARKKGYTPSRATTLPTRLGGATQIGSKRAFPIKLKNGLTSSRV
jgi:hypothetical protein